MLLDSWTTNVYIFNKWNIFHVYIMANDGLIKRFSWADCPELGSTCLNFTVIQLNDKTLLILTIVNLILTIDTDIKYPKIC